jgi:hypothetical protein
MSLSLTSLLYRNAKTWAPVNLDRLQHWIDQGRITSSPEQPITARELFLSKCIHNVHDGIKILGDVSSLNLDGRYFTKIPRAMNILKHLSMWLPLEQVRPQLTL